MSKKRKEKRRKFRKKVVTLRPVIPSVTPTVCGFKINKEKHNRVWRWDTLEDVTF